MKLRIALTIVFTLLLVSSNSTVRAQRQTRVTADSGVITLGPNQVLRITIVNAGKANSRVRFRRMEYSQGVCNGAVCKHSQVSDSELGTATLAPGESASVDLGNTSFGVRGVAFMD